MKAPKFVSWSAENRSQLIRVPAASGEYKRAELRSPDPSANPYIAFALIIRAGLYGIRNGLKLPSPVDINLFRADPEVLSKLAELPGDLISARAAAASDPFIVESLPAEIREIYLA